MRCLYAVSSWFVQRTSLTVNIDLSDVTNKYYTVLYRTVVVYEKKNRSLVFSGSRKIQALGLGFFCPHWTPMMDSIYPTLTRIMDSFSCSLLFYSRRSRRDIVLMSSVRPFRPSVHTFCLSRSISQYLLVRFDSFLVQMISTMDAISYKFG